MNPTDEYEAWKGSEKYRLTCVSGDLHAALEHGGIGTVPSIYLSMDGGRTFERLGWKLAGLGHLKQLFHGLEWPPRENISELSIEEGRVVLRCAQSNEVDIIWRKFSYDVKHAAWRSESAH